MRKMRKETVKIEKYKILLYFLHIVVPKTDANIFSEKTPEAIESLC